jgi:hypothetical protein
MLREEREGNLVLDAELRTDPRGEIFEEPDRSPDRIPALTGT